MGLKQCDKCSEMVDEAKAFCPGCGNSFVIETKREVVSNFESFEGTINLGDTMFNQMLSDMGLNISKTPDVAEKRVEVLAPEPPAVIRPDPIAKTPKPSSNIKWFIIGGVALLLVFLMVVVAGVLVYMFWPR